MGSKPVDLESVPSGPIHPKPFEFRNCVTKSLHLEPVHLVSRFRIYSLRNVFVCLEPKYSERFTRSSSIRSHCIRSPRAQNSNWSLIEKSWRQNTRNNFQAFLSFVFLYLKFSFLPFATLLFLECLIFFCFMFISIFISSSFTIYFYSS